MWSRALAVKELLNRGENGRRGCVRGNHQGLSTACARLHSEPGVLFVVLRYPSETMAGRWDWMV